MASPPWSSSPSQWFVLVTGANGGLGYSICQRTISEHFDTPARPRDQHLVIIVSTRSPSKTRSTVAKLRLYLRKYAETSSFAQNKRRLDSTYRWQNTVSRVHFLGVELDLCNLQQIYAASARIRGEGEGLCVPDFPGLGLAGMKIPRLDALVLNAGMIGIEGIRWGPAIWDCIVNTAEAMTYWEHNIPSLGRRVGKQIQEKDGKVSEEDEPTLGEVFCANVFGHYVLAHELMPLLHAAEGSEHGKGDRGRIIWISSLEALGNSFDVEDIQALSTEETTDPYRSSKRLTDILVLTANLPSVQKISAPYFETSKDRDDDTTTKPEMYLAHPGICATSIIPLPLVLTWSMLLGFYFARLLGSVWHTISTFKGAVAVSWLILADSSFLDSCEDRDGKTKWGSSTDRLGEERVRRTWVPGWGFGGKELGGWNRVNGVKKDTIPLTREDRETFEDVGKKVWTDMEELRVRWETLLKHRSP